MLGVLLEGLARLEYRGYDSAGMALVGAGEGDGLWRARAANGTRSLDDLTKRAEDGTQGGRRRESATPAGPPTEARPRGTPTPTSTARAGMALIHNGIIENHVELADELAAAGHRFESDTDTEVLVHLIEAALAAGPADGLAAAVRAALGRVRGAFSVAVVHADEPELVVAARRVSPAADGGHRRRPPSSPRTSRPSSGSTRDFFVLEDDQIAELRPGSIRVTAPDGTEVEPGPHAPSTGTSRRPARTATTTS